MKEPNISTYMAAAILAADSNIPEFRSTEKHQPISGRIIGWDNGKSEKKQPRNSKCKCGSGMKAKRCCG